MGQFIEPQRVLVETIQSNPNWWVPIAAALISFVGVIVGIIYKRRKK